MRHQRLVSRTSVLTLLLTISLSAACKKENGSFFLSRNRAIERSVSSSDLDAIPGASPSPIATPTPLAKPSPTESPLTTTTQGPITPQSSPTPLVTAPPSLIGTWEGSCGSNTDVTSSRLTFEYTANEEKFVVTEYLDATCKTKKLEWVIVSSYKVGGPIDHAPRFFAFDKTPIKFLVTPDKSTADLLANEVVSSSNEVCKRLTFTIDKATDISSCYPESSRKPIYSVVAMIDRQLYVGDCPAIGGTDEEGCNAPDKRATKAFPVGFKQ